MEMYIYKFKSLIILWKEQLIMTKLCHICPNTLHSSIIKIMKSILLVKIEAILALH